MANTTGTVKSPPSKPAARKPKQTTDEIRPAKAKPKTAAKAAAKVKPAAARKPAKSLGKKPVVVPPEQRRCYVEVAAYHIAERRGFAPGDPLADWIQAEAEIDRLLAAGLLGS